MRDGLEILAGVTTAFLDAWLHGDSAAKRFFEDFEANAAITAGRARFAQK